MDRKKELLRALHGWARRSGIAEGLWRVVPLSPLAPRSFRLISSSSDVVLRLPTRATGGDGKAEIAAQAAAATRGLAPAILYADAADGWFVTPFLAQARALPPEDCGDRAVIERLAGLFKRLHGSGLAFPKRRLPFATIDDYLPLGRDPRLKAWRRILEPAAKRLAGSPRPPAPCHIDPHCRNLLRQPNGELLLIDWEYAAMSEPLWDIAAFSIAADLLPDMERQLLAATVGLDHRERYEDYKLSMHLIVASWADAELARNGEPATLSSLRERHIAALASASRQA